MIGGSQKVVTLMMDTLSPNLLAFDGKILRKKYPAMSSADTEFYTKEGNQIDDKETIFRRADKSSYWGNMWEDTVKLEDSVDTKLSVVLDKFVFGTINRVNDAALILRSVDHGGVLGLNPFVTAVKGGTNLLMAMVDKRLIADPSFTFSVAADGGSQDITFGGANEKLREKLVYFPVVGGLSSREEPTSWAMKFEKLMIDDEVIIPNFVAEFDSSLSSGLSDMESIRHLYSQKMAKHTAVHQDTTKEMFVVCRTRASLPKIQLVAKDAMGNPHIFTFDGEYLFSTEYKGLCGSSFFENPELDDDSSSDDNNGPEGSAGESEPPYPTRIRFGLGAMKRFHMIDFRLMKAKRGNKKGGGEISGQIGIGYKEKGGGGWLNFFGGY